MIDVSENEKTTPERLTKIADDLAKVMQESTVSLEEATEKLYNFLEVASIHCEDIELLQ